ncbi:DUF3833 domain-containing protein [Phaeobacter inhibens]|uniref:DUF3833 domain-containing protein n=1 Tax=Phaeobacter inhibens TaxID=221822 RepID=UPI0001632A4F|nr:DUF3833 domain-containing protein [Phaeobacter inhibens]AFO89955.1 hypothetical protein PGA1_c02120 [Phaeobacter inhibens DSM 17395]AUQ44583.1 hypothetical protein PhaeoP10_00211 [Phaeobacter inhibens]AUQ55660.1 hypothetical protein PhaeoP92_03022 [Phaeobacter inhibens]AUQ59847.1 hypothetical protein PhaeoP30_02968 [Phaeobacter inhibens]AUQ63897.1 hypothetical protein PhaeoP51_02951 [Phaeobacter inhibens]
MAIATETPRRFRIGRWAALGAGAAAVAALASCGRPSLTDEKLSDKTFNLEEYFEGKTVAYGQFADRFGTVRRRFKVDITGEWDGRVLTLAEDFRYADGSTEQRIWSLTKTGENTWEGSADGVQGIAKGEERGDTFNWGYTIDLPVPGGDTMRVTFDDWMWLLEDGRLLNKAYMSRYGVTLGEVTIFFEKL